MEMFVRRKRQIPVSLDDERDVPVAVSPKDMQHFSVLLNDTENGSCRFFSIEQLHPPRQFIELISHMYSGDRTIKTQLQPESLSTDDKYPASNSRKSVRNMFRLI